MRLLFQNQDACKQTVIKVQEFEEKEEWRLWHSTEGVLMRCELTPKGCERRSFSDKGGTAL